MRWYLSDKKREPSPVDLDEPFYKHTEARTRNRELMLERGKSFSVKDILYDAMFWVKIKIMNFCTCQCICQ